MCLGFNHGRNVPTCVLDRWDETGAHLVANQAPFGGEICVLLHLALASFPQLCCVHTWGSMHHLPWPQREAVHAPERLSKRCVTPWLRVRSTIAAANKGKQTHQEIAAACRTELQHGAGVRRRRDDGAVHRRLQHRRPCFFCREVERALEVNGAVIVLQPERHHRRRRQHLHSWASCQGQHAIDWAGTRCERSSKRAPPHRVPETGAP